MVKIRGQFFCFDFSHILFNAMIAVGQVIFYSIIIAAVESFKYMFQTQKYITYLASISS